MAVKPDKYYAVPGSPVCWALHGDLLIVLSRPNPIDDQLFERFIGDIREHPWKKCLGAAVAAINMTSIQRSQVAAEFKNKPTAAITDHSVARGVATALSWLGLQIRAWSWAQMDKAFDYLELDSSQKAVAVELLERLKSESE